MPIGTPFYYFKVFLSLVICSLGSVFCIFGFGEINTPASTAGPMNLNSPIIAGIILGVIGVLLFLFSFLFDKKYHRYFLAMVALSVSISVFINVVYYPVDDGAFYMLRYENIDNVAYPSPLAHAIAVKIAAAMAIFVTLQWVRTIQCTLKINDSLSAIFFLILFIWFSSITFNYWSYILSNYKPWEIEFKLYQSATLYQWWWKLIFTVIYPIAVFILGIRIKKTKWRFIFIIIPIYITLFYATTLVSYLFW